MKYIVTIIFIHMCLIASAQLGLTKEQVIKRQGSKYTENKTKDGFPFIEYLTNSKSSKTGATIPHDEVYYFKENICSAYLIIEPISEIDSWEKVIGKTCTKIADMKWENSKERVKVEMFKAKLSNGDEMVKIFWTAY